MQDPLGVFVPDGLMSRQDIALGPLAGLTFAVKDLFAVAGHRATCGNPDWARAHPPAEADAAAVKACLDAGATLTGRTVMDELAYSVSGSNPHYGTPTNPDAPGRLTGGSSGGSAAAVAGGLVDFALGTDTGGSVRVPASYCGVYGLRPTHGAVSLDGAMPLAPGFDTVGWFARDPEVMEAVGAVLLPPAPAESPTLPSGLIVASDALALATPETREALAPWIDHLRRRFEGGTDVELASSATGPLSAWRDAFRHLQAREAHDSFKDWIAEHDPRLGPEMRERWAFATEARERDTSADEATRAAVRARLRALTDGGRVIALPCAPAAAPRIDADPDELAEHRLRVLSLTAPAGLAGLPQIALPLARVGGLPIGVGLIGPAGGDRQLLRLACEIANQVARDPGARFD
jgi:amidase